MHSKLEETTFHPAQGGIAERARDAFNLWRNAFQVPPFLECAITALDLSSSAQAGPITGPYCLPQEISFMLVHRCPLRTSILYLGHFADLGNRHIPSAFIIGYTYVAVVPHIDHRLATCRNVIMDWAVVKHFVVC